MKPKKGWTEKEWDRFCDNVCREYFSWCKAQKDVCPGDFGSWETYIREKYSGSTK